MLFFAAGINSVNFLKTYYEASLTKINIMLSYHTVKDNVIEKVQKFSPYVDKFMLDSGAFSVYSKEDLLTNLLNTYPLYLKNNRNDLENIFYAVYNLDYKSGQDTFSFSENLDMFKSLYKVYPKIVPVIHNIDAINPELDIYEKYSPEIIAIGQNEKRGKEKFRNLLQDTINRIRTKSRCHLLGVSDFKIINNVYNVTSVDSKSWLDDSVKGKIVRYFDYDINSQNRFHEICIKFPENMYCNKKSGEILYDELDNNTKEKFLNEMKDKLGLTREDFFTANREVTRQLANLYYIQKKISLISQFNNPNENLASSLII